MPSFQYLCWTSSPRFPSSFSNPTDPRWKISLHPRSVSLPDYPPSFQSPGVKLLSLVLRTISFPNSVDSTHVIYPTPFCIAETLLQFFITLGLWCGPGILSGLSSSCLSYSQSILYTVANFHSSKTQGPACHGQVHARQFKISTTLPRVAGHSSVPPFHFIHSACMCTQSLQSCHTLCDTMGCSPPGSSVH